MCALEPTRHRGKRGGHTRGGHAGSGPARTPRSLHSQRGISLIELMVGMVVALLVGLAATGSAAMFTASQRQGIGIGGALVNATTALNAIRDDASVAGLGFFGDSNFLCTKLNLSVDASVVQDGANFAPVQITPESAAGDRVDVVYATQVASGANVLLNAATTAAAGGTAQLRSLLPVAAGQAVLLAPTTPGDPCLVRTVTLVAQPAVDVPQLLTFASSGIHNKAAFSTNPLYVDRARMALLGSVKWQRYRLNGTDLQLERPMGGAPVVLARNVVGFRAQYGTRTTGTTSLDNWVNATGSFATLDATTLPRVRALRIGLVTRSPQREKPDANGVCQASASKPKDPFDPAVDLATDVGTDWPCYRYRTAIVVVPLRNLVIGQP